MHTGVFFVFVRDHVAAFPRQGSAVQVRFFNASQQGGKSSRYILVFRPCIPPLQEHAERLA